MSALKVHIEEAGYSPQDIKIHGISFHVNPGELVGLIGPNGAGKSTTMKTILGVMRVVKGNIQIGDDGKGKYAYVPEQPVLYETMTMKEHLQLAAAAYNMTPEQYDEVERELTERFQMQDVLHQYPTSFSKGMQQKLMLILAFMLKPSLYIVDEPFVGLDPRATKRFLDMLSAEREQGAGVLMSTHVLDTAERICDRFILIHGGRMIANGTLDELREQSGLEKGTLMDIFEVLT
ncbi:MAG: ABC transporter ATP-binding protein [Paenibacillus sp.]|uniref:ABC-2 type transport system ATP-binding protein n=1 Tax=Paenibacillus aquistagni TaxID=1852522 RepID=A0A1X7LBN2_9BACL|nr:ABC transporter ATP-binding protein [Paenibacillus aquistagni]MBR2568835.1 ABC transporter ATP-binding protein [Paenibacillus sp.]NMM53049.1 ABC transporter ATP-binding protein [Paenibacillus aquistagni]SMG51246.1 ABC-2 type transport system ATP-binding protein [Paenibacillus aquistagni]